MQIIDTHCHLYAEDFNADREEMLQRAIQAGVSHFLLPNIDLDSIPGLYALSDGYPSVCLPMMGLHPTSVKEDYKAVLTQIEAALHSRPFIAVGEIGLDYYWDKTFTLQQQDAFRTQIDWAKSLQLPIAIHTRSSFDDALLIVQEAQKAASLTGVFHCFSGTAEEAQKVIDTGFYMGIGGVVTFKNSGLDKALADVPLDYLILETDAPYLAPVPYRGKRNESAYLTEVLKKLAALYNVSGEEIAARTTENAKKLFGLA